MVRYSAAPIIAVLNPPMSAAVRMEVSRAGIASADGMSFRIDEAGGAMQVRTGTPPRTSELTFGPAVPNLLVLQDGASEAGTWRWAVGDSPVTGGVYRTVRHGNRVTVELDLTETWKPRDLPLGFRMFVALARSFRTWPTTYRWTGELDLETNVVTGSWERKARRR